MMQRISRAGRSQAARRRVARSPIVRVLAVAVPSLALATIAIALLESFVGVPNASAVYLVAVVACAIVAGTPGAIVASLSAFLLYDWFFTFPYYTLTIRDPSEWLSVILLLFVGIVVGQLAAVERSRTEVARAREREARALFRVSRELATRESTPAALATIVGVLAAETSMDRVWLALGADDATERIAADSGTGPKPPKPGVMSVLRRTPGDDPARWVRVHQPTARGRAATGMEGYRVRMDAGGAPVGSIWALRDRRNGDPDRTETRLLSAAADQVGQAIAHDRLAAEAQAAEIARQSDALKSALLQSVSHDLRTPLATIRAAAGSLRPGSGLTPAEQLESAEAIDREVEYLNRLVTNLLDLSRIEAGALRAERDVFELDDLVERTLDRVRDRLAPRNVVVDVGAEPVDVDPIFFDEALTNVLENAIKYAPSDATVRIVAQPLSGARFVRLTVEDSGAGVPAEALPHLFEKFYRVGRGRGSRSGTGIGLAVVQGLIEATGGRVDARRGELGGLAIDMDLPAATVPSELLVPAGV